MPLMAFEPIDVASVINLSEGSGARCKFVYQIYPPVIDILVTGMVGSGEKEICEAVAGHK